jgi:CheY-like chemotaxis protein
MRAIQVLLVDDNPADVDLIGEVLARRSGIHVNAVTDGVAAISFFRAEGVTPMRFHQISSFWI